MTTHSLTALALAIALAACAPEAVDARAGIDTHDGVDTESSPCTSGWEDPETGLCWQLEAREAPLTWPEARDHCEALVVDDQDDWRLPTIDELRSLVRSCPHSEWGGTCRVAHGSALEDWNTADCVGCPYLQGLGEDGTYWEPTVEGPTSRGYWSSSEVADRLGESWCMYSQDAFISWESQAMDDHHVRCVRGSR